MKSRVYDRTDGKGDETQVIEYRASILTTADFATVTNVIKNISLHKDFLYRTTVSKKLEQISDTGSLNYYYFDSPWPMPNSDCVTEMTYNIDEKGKKAEFKLVAKPEIIEKTDVKRIELYNVSYLIEPVADNQLKVSVNAEFIPVSRAPAFLVSTWFPDGPADILKRIVKLSHLPL